MCRQKEVIGWLKQLLGCSWAVAIIFWGIIKWLYICRALFWKIFHPMFATQRLFVLSVFTPICIHTWIIHIFISLYLCNDSKDIYKQCKTSRTIMSTSGTLSSYISTWWHWKNMRYVEWCVTVKVRVCACTCVSLTLRLPRLPTDIRSSSSEIYRQTKKRSPNIAECALVAQRWLTRLNHIDSGSRHLCSLLSLCAYFGIQSFRRRRYHAGIHFFFKSKTQLIQV